MRVSEACVAGAPDKYVGAKPGASVWKRARGRSHAQKERVLQRPTEIVYLFIYSFFFFSFSEGTENPIGRERPEGIICCFRRKSVTQRKYKSLFPRFSFAYNSLLSGCLLLSHAFLLSR